jgi:hypothetical protein
VAASKPLHRSLRSSNSPDEGTAALRSHEWLEDGGQQRTATLESVKGSDMPNFESFSKRLLPSRGTPVVTIQRRGAMSLNRSAWSAIDSPKAVELLFDRTSHIVGLRPVEPDADNAYPVRPATSAAGPFLISAMAFSHFYEIDTTVARRWPAYVEDGVLCVDLRSNAGVPVTSNRAARSVVRHA